MPKNVHRVTAIPNINGKNISILPTKLIKLYKFYKLFTIHETPQVFIQVYTAYKMWLLDEEVPSYAQSL